jgi:hypothetical protein
MFNKLTGKTAAAESKPAAPASTTTAPAVEPKKIDLNKPSIKDAIAKGKVLIKDGNLRPMQRWSFSRH